METSPARRSRTSATSRTASIGETAMIEVLLHAQSADIAQGVDAAGNKDEGAGDQGIMFGYACRRDAGSDAGAALLRAQNSAKLLAKARKSGQASNELGPDAKSQVTVRYDDGKPVGATQIVAFAPSMSMKTSTVRDVREIVEPYIVKALPEGWITNKTVWHVNPDRQIRHRRTRRRRAASPAARSSSTLTAARLRMAAAPSPARIRPRWIAPPPMRRAIWPRTSSRPAWPIAARSSSPTRSASPSRCRSMSIRMAPAKVEEAKLEEVLLKIMRPVAARHSRAPPAQSPIYARTSAYGHFGREPDRRRRLLLGKDRSGREAQGAFRLIGRWLNRHET